MFFFWEDEDFHRTDCDFDIKFEDECKASLVFHYVVKSEKNVLLYGDGGGGGGGEHCTAWYLTLYMVVAGVGGNTAPPGILHYIWYI